MMGVSTKICNESWKTGDQPLIILPPDKSNLQLISQPSEPNFCFIAV